MNNIHIFHAGTSLLENTIVTSGGRVLALTGLGESFEAARHNVYKAVDKIFFEGMVYRKDIALKVIRYFKSYFNVIQLIKLFIKCDLFLDIEKTCK